MKISNDTMADVGFRLRWESEYAAHIENYAGQQINLWRDCFPQPVLQALKGKSEGESVSFDFPAGEIVPMFQDKNLFHIKPAQFDPGLKGNRRLRPRYGRFYPKGMLKDITGIFKANVEPFRCAGVEDSRITADFNHPLSQASLTVEATVGKVWRKSKERGGTCNDWLERLTEGPGMQVRWNGAATDFFAETALNRPDTAADSVFYQAPRMVDHVDAEARSVITGLYNQLLEPDTHVLDLMASWNSHLPEQLPLKSVTGLGMNQTELDANARLDRRIVHDLNQKPELPFGDAEFDTAVCTVSIEYLTHPFRVMDEIARVLKPGGLFVATFSNRWFPTKAIEIWQELHEFERMGLVLEYFLQGNRFRQLETYSMRGRPRPEDDKYYGQLFVADPVYAVWGRRAEKDR